MEVVKAEDVFPRLSPDIRAKSGGWFFQVLLFGIPYFIPVTTELKKLLGVRIRNGRAVYRVYADEHKIENLFRDLVASVYLQIRDTVGSEIKDQLSRQMEDGFTNLFSKMIGNRVDDALNMLLPGPPKPKE